MADLETRLRALAAEAELPPTPAALASTVRARIEATPVRGAGALGAGRGRLLSRRGLAVAVACALAVPAAAIAAVPDARDAVLDWLGLRSVEVRRVPSPPRRSGPPGRPGLGRAATLAAARASVGFRVLVPARLRAAPRVYVAASPPGGRVSLLYAGPPRVLITEFRGSRTRAFLEKAIGPGTHVERVDVDGAPGAWISGRAHAFVYADARGLIRQERRRLAGDVLVWERAGVVYRLEGRLSKAGALRLARSFE